MANPVSTSEPRRSTLKGVPPKSGLEQLRRSRDGYMVRTCFALPQPPYAYSLIVHTFSRANPPTCVAQRMCTNFVFQEHATAHATLSWAQTIYDPSSHWTHPLAEWSPLKKGCTRTQNIYSARAASHQLRCSGQQVTSACVLRCNSKVSLLHSYILTIRKLCH